MRAPWILLVVGLVLATGCLEAATRPPSEAAPPRLRPIAPEGEGPTTAPAPHFGADAPEEDVAVVLVRGTLTINYPERRVGVCGFPSPPEIDARTRRIHFHNERFDPGRTGAIALAIVWDNSLCGTADTTLRTAAQPDALELPLRPGERVGLRWLENGTVETDGWLVPPGFELEQRRDGRTAEGHPYELTLVVANHGAWPRAHVTFAETAHAHTG